MPNATTPIAIIESYFDLSLDRSALSRFDEVTEDQWIDFAKHYLAQMEHRFADDFLQPSSGADASLRLYFEPRMSHEWDSAVTKQYRPTPLLGLNPRPPSQHTITRNEVSTLLNPLKKHLLFADSVYFRDSFYYCFDAVADSVNRTKWRSDPNVRNLVHDGIQSIKNWLPILIELRPFIESKALVFMPYYITPAFPYAGVSPKLQAYVKQLRLRPDPEAKPQKPVAVDFKKMIEHMRAPRAGIVPPGNDAPDRFSEDDVIGAWLNARILQLDPVFPNKAMSDWAARLHFDEGADTVDVTSDLISIDVLPFGHVKEIGLDDLWSIRKNENVFDEVQRIVVACKKYIETNLTTSATKQGVNDASRTFLRDKLREYESKSVLKFVDENAIAGVGVSIAVGAALLTANPAIGLLAGAVFTPQIARKVQRKFDPTRRAYAQLQALL